MSQHNKIRFFLLQTNAKKNATSSNNNRKQITQPVELGSKEGNWLLECQRYKGEEGKVTTVRGKCGGEGKGKGGLGKEGGIIVSLYIF